MKTWVKLYTEIINDPKIARLTWEERGMWCALLALAGRLEARKSDGIESGCVGNVEEIGWYLRIEVDLLTPVLVHFSELGMLRADGESWYIIHWEQRQARPPSDSQAAWRDRQQKHRAVTKPDESTSLDCHEDVTRMSRNRIDTDKSEIVTEESKIVTREESARDRLVTCIEPATTKEDSRPHPRPRPLVILTEITKWYPAPNSEPYKLILSSVQDEPKNLERWREAVTAWVNCGNSMRNIQGMVDWYKTGRRDSRQRVPESNMPTAEELHDDLLEKCRIWQLQNPKKLSQKPDSVV